MCVYIHIYTHIFSLANFHSVQSEWEQNEAVSAACGCVSALCVCHHYLCGQLCIYVYVMHMCTVCVLCACAYWEYNFHLAAAWTWGHGAAVASHLSGCLIWPDTLP